MYLALDPAGIAGHPLPTGLIVGLNPTANGLVTAGFPRSTYTGNRRVLVDESTAAWDNDCTVGWYWQNGAVVQALALSNAEIVQSHIDQFRELFESTESSEFQQLLAREKVDTVVDSGHSWVDDIIHGWVKPWLRLIENQLATEKAKASPDPTAYGADLLAFNRQVVTPGLLGFHRNAIRSEWRPLRTGLVAWEYDAVDGGTKANSNRTVSYPDGFTVATWSAYTAIQNL